MDWRNRSGRGNWRLYPVRGSLRWRSISALRPRRSSNSRGSRSPASEVTVAPRNSTRSCGLNERRIGPDVVSPIGGGLRISEEPQEPAFSAGVERLWPGPFTSQNGNADLILVASNRHQDSLSWAPCDPTTCHCSLVRGEERVCDMNL